MKAGLIGYPVSHSLSPQIFSMLSRLNNIPLDYDTLEIHPDYVESAMNEFPWKSYVGLNVTSPYKDFMKNYTTNLDPVADAVGVINVVKVKHEDCGIQRIGYNTDAYGFLKSLEEEKIQLKGMDCLIFGTGGAAKAAIYALKSAGVKSITVASRSPEKLRYLGVPVEKYSDTMNADLYINATPLGTKNFHESESPYKGSFKKDAVVFDMVYRPAHTSFLKHAETFGAKTMDGIDMLIWQALKTWEIWFDQSVIELKKEISTEVFL